MHKKVYAEFEKICAGKHISGTVLEVGATPDASSLLNMESLKNASAKIGINLDGPYQLNGFKILKGNANYMPEFPDNSFDAVLCNAVLEHDKYFWKTISEIKRVAKPGGLIVIGAPGFTALPYEKYAHSFLKPLPGNFITASTLTLHIHNYPGDYYRFSGQAFREIIFEGLNEVSVFSVLTPPRLIGSGIKPKI